MNRMRTMCILSILFILSGDDGLPMLVKLAGGGTPEMG
jgi:hypothetical protein